MVAMEGHPSGSKVAIARVERPQQEPTPRTVTKGKQTRITSACTNCRKRKVKCSGETPHCQNCKAIGLNCIYEQARKDRLKATTLKNESLIFLLKGLSIKADDEDKKRIEDVLKEVEDDVAPAPAPTVSTNALGKRSRRHSPEDADEETNDGEAYAPASVGSNDDLDLLDEDLLRSRKSRETGYVGQNSEVQWLRSLQRQIAQVGGEPKGLPYGPPGSSKEAIAQRSDALHTRRSSSKAGPVLPVIDSTFYLDDDSIELDLVIDPHKIPSLETAQHLFNSFMSTVHGSFPIIPTAFEDQFRRYYDSVHQNLPFEVPRKWLAILNLVFAIGARYSHLTDVEWQGDDQDHLVYMTRAVRLLGLEDTAMVTSAPDLMLIQANGILSLYYLVVGHVSKAWVIIGIAIRLALAVGLHLRNEDPSSSTKKKESLVRTWWSLHSIECLLSAITGRPWVLPIEDTTIPLPQAPLEEQQISSSTSGPTKRIALMGSYLDAHITIGIITQRALTSLYTPRTASRSWEYVQKTIPSLLMELEEWYASTCTKDFGVSHVKPNSQRQRERFLLQFYYCSTKIIITRPCLCRIERRIYAQSNKSAGFNQNTAEACVHAAQQLADLLPNQPDAQYIYINGPWWSIVHNIMQAMAVLLLELSYEGSHMTTRGPELTTCAKKLVHWLRAMRKNDAVADRAYKLIYSILNKCGPPFQATAAELLAEDLTDNQPCNQPYQVYSDATSQSTGWQQGFYIDPNLGLAGFDPQSVSSQQDYVGGYQSELDSYFLSDQPQMRQEYANMFWTSFDQDVQIPVAMEDLSLPMLPMEGPNMGGAGMDFAQQDQPPLQ